MDPRINIYTQQTSNMHKTWSAYLCNAVLDLISEKRNKKRLNSTNFYFMRIQTQNIIHNYAVVLKIQHNFYTKIKIGVAPHVTVNGTLLGFVLYSFRDRKIKQLINVSTGQHGKCSYISVSVIKSLAVSFLLFSHSNSTLFRFGTTNSKFFFLYVIATNAM